jgi:hypothetical protein
MIAPEQNMPLKKYLGLLEELGMDRSRVQRLSEKKINMTHMLKRACIFD